jgi:protein-S-isoprenylcysteine O-methyltransferase Ste14
MRSRRAAAAGSALWFLAAPGLVAGLVPWLLTGWEVDDAYWLPLRAVGVVLVAGGAAVLVHAFARFVQEGIGTPAPVAPPGQLVVGGLYRFVRNPMYVAVEAIVIGQGLFLGEAALLAYAAAIWIVMAAFVVLYEEPALSRTFGSQYEIYRRAVPRWLPRRRPWTQETTHGFHPQAGPDRRRPG